MSIDNEEKEAAPFTVYFDNKEKQYLMYVQNSRFISRNDNGEITEEKCILVRYIGGRSMVFSEDIWNTVGAKSGIKRFEQKEL